MRLFSNVFLFLMLMFIVSSAKSQKSNETKIQKCLWGGLCTADSRKDTDPEESDGYEDDSVDEPLDTLNAWPIRGTCDIFEDAIVSAQKSKVLAKKKKSEFKIQPNECFITPLEAGASENKKTSNPTPSTLVENYSADLSATKKLVEDQLQASSQEMDWEFNDALCNIAHKAITENNLATLDYLMTVLDASSCQDLFITAESQKNIDAARILAKNNYSLDLYEGDRVRSPLWNAIMRGNSRFIDFYFSLIAERNRPEALNVALMFACGAPNYLLFQQFINQGADLNSTEGKSCLYEAMSTYWEPDWMWRYFSSTMKNKPNNRNKIFNFFMSLKAQKILGENYSDVIAWNENDRNPLSEAIEYSDQKRVVALLKKGVLPSANDWDSIGNNIKLKRIIAKFELRFNVAEQDGDESQGFTVSDYSGGLYPENSKVADADKYLISSGYATPIDLAAYDGDLFLVKHMYKRLTCNEDSFNKINSALANAALNGRIRVVRYLLSKGAVVRKIILTVA